jgi:hypothetical protein
MKCGWGCGEQLIGRNMRAHFTTRAKRPAASDHVDRRGGTCKPVWPPTGAADAMRLALRRQTHGEPDARALHNSPHRWYGDYTLMWIASRVAGNLFKSVQIRG